MKMFQVKINNFASLDYDKISHELNSYLIQVGMSTTTFVIPIQIPVWYHFFEIYLNLPYLNECLKNLVYNLNLTYESCKYNILLTI